MKSCKDLQEKLLSFLKGEDTSPFKKDLIEKHLRQCKACGEEFQSIKKTDLLLETARLSEPQKAPEKILAAITNRPKKSTRRAVIQHRPRHAWAMPTAAVILFGLVLYFALRTPDPVKATVNTEGKKLTLSVESGKIDLQTEEGRIFVAQGETTRLQELPQLVREKISTPPSQGEDQAWEKYTQGAYQEAFTLFHSALENRKSENPLNNTAIASLLTGTGWSLYWQQEYEEASAQFQSAIKMESTSADARRGLGYCHYRLGNYDLAISTLGPVGKEVPTWIDVQLTLGWAEYWTTRYSNAIPYFQAAQKLNPFLAEPSIGLGWSYYKNDQPQMARNTFINALTLYPEYFQDKDFQALLSYRSDWLSLQLSVAWAYYNKMNYDRAEESFLSFLEKLDEENSVALAANTRCGLGWTLYKKGNRNSAEEQFDLALKIAPSDSNALLGKQLCMQTGSIPKEN